MKTKKILRFYFSAESLDRAFDNLIAHKACDCGADAFKAAEGLCDVIGERMGLERLWAYLDGILSVFSDKERGTLHAYSLRRAAPLKGAALAEAKRSIIKFTRRARRLADFGYGISVLNKYYCLITDG